jgi:aminoglycoside phosphotransferase (APT) family kinase protein
MSDGIIGDVVPALRFDEAKLKAHLESKIDNFGANMRVQQIKGGASNPTYKLTTDVGAYVLRKKPPGQLLASAHQVDREYRVMKALENTGVPVPRMRLLEADESIIGTGFYVMNFLEGRVFRDARLPGLSPKERAAVYDELNATLAKLHQVDYQAVGLGDFGRPSGYFERQVARWTKQYRGAESEHIPAMEKLIEVLPGMIPADPSVSIAHGDYRLENMMYHATEPRLIAVLDWELCTIGHPLADIGYNGFMWHSHGESWGTLDGVDFKTSGIPTESEYRDAYCRRTGRDHIDNWNFYVAFGVFRLASIGQGVYRRALAGVTPSDRPTINGTAAMAEQALEILYR